MNLTNDEPPSPCVKNCCLNDDDICLGCFRSLEEIMRWTKVDKQTRQHFLANAKHRREAQIEMTIMPFKGEI